MSALRFAAVLVLGSGVCVAAPVPENKSEINGWGQTIDPDKDCKFQAEKGGLTIVVPGKDHDLGIERGVMNAPRVLRPVEGDFIVQVKVSGKFEPGDPVTDQRAAFNGAGLLILKDDRNYVRLERATFHRGGDPTIYTVFEVRKDGEIERFAQGDDFKLEADKDTYLRMERRGDKIFGAVSQEKDKWHYMAPRPVELPKELKVGVGTVNTSKTEFAPRFDEFKLFVDVGPAK
jgi:regulation of enolase protein 1 (concanavalin A-like superfamily)